MRNRNLVKRVQSLYTQGFKQREIALTFRKNSSIISRWCRKPLGIIKPTLFSSHQEKLRYYWFTSLPIKIDTLDRNLATLLLSTLYWCEGAKYPGTNRVDFVSSDEKMQILFIKLLRFVFSKEIDESKFRVMLQLHTTHNVSSIINYWSNLLNIPIKQFAKPHITTNKNTKYRHIYNGTCGLRYYDYRILLKIMGGYNQISNQIIDRLI